MRNRPVIFSCHGFRAFTPSGMCLVACAFANPAQGSRGRTKTRGIPPEATQNRLQTFLRVWGVPEKQVFLLALKESSVSLGESTQGSPRVRTHKWLIGCHSTEPTSCVPLDSIRCACSAYSKSSMPALASWRKEGGRGGSCLFVLR